MANRKTYKTYKAPMSTSGAAECNAFTPRTVEALERIQDQLDNGDGQVETGIDVSREREEADKDRLGLRV